MTLVLKENKLFRNGVDITDQVTPLAEDMKDRWRETGIVAIPVHVHKEFDGWASRFDGHYVLCKTAQLLYVDEHPVFGLYRRMIERTHEAH